MGLPETMKDVVFKGLADHFPCKGSKEIAAYFGLLTVLETNGHPVPLNHIEYVRAILQHPQYEKWMIGGEGALPVQRMTKIFEGNVRKSAEEMLTRMQLKSSEKAFIAARLFKVAIIGEPGNRPCSLADILARTRRVQQQLQRGAQAAPSAKSAGP